MKKIILAPLVLLLSLPLVRAHCPLCTIGAAAAAGGASLLGVDKIVIGLFIGAFAVSMGWWFAGLIKKKFFKFQGPLIIILSFVSTVFPMVALLSEVNPWYIPWIGQYGTTLAIDFFLVGAFLGGAIVSVAPLLSKKLTQVRKGKMVPFQGILLTFLLLTLTGIILQVML